MTYQKRTHSDCRVVVFGGPSLPQVPLPCGAEIRPPARRRDIIDCARTYPKPVIVLIDGTFLQYPSPTHYDLLSFLHDGGRLIGAASMGALRASELRNRGMIGIGAVYQAIVQNLLIDDSEVAVMMSSSDYRPLTIPLVTVRRLLFLARQRGVIETDLGLAFHSASNIYFADRTKGRLSAEWARMVPRCATVLTSMLDHSEIDIKASDSLEAIQFASALLLTDSSVPIDHHPSQTTFHPPLWFAPP